MRFKFKKFPLPFHLLPVPYRSHPLGSSEGLHQPCNGMHSHTTFGHARHPLPSHAQLLAQCPFHHLLMQPWCNISRPIHIRNSYFEECFAVLLHWFVAHTCSWREQEKYNWYSSSFMNDEKPKLYNWGFYFSGRAKKEHWAPKFYNWVFPSLMKDEKTAHLSCTIAAFVFHERWKKQQLTCTS